MFDETIKSIKDEIRNLKCWYAKRANQLKTITKEIDVQYTYKKNPDTGELYMTQDAIITMTTLNNLAPLVSYGVDTQDLQDRYIYFEGTMQENQSIEFILAASTDNASDKSTAESGGEVKIDFKVYFTSTVNFNLELTYKDNQ